MVGSLIKNGGGGIAPTGGYIAGRADLVERCGHWLTAPGTGRELGCTLDTLRQLYLGLYYAPGVTAEAVKTSIYSSCLLSCWAREPTPRYTARPGTTSLPASRRAALRRWWRSARGSSRAAR